MKLLLSLLFAVAALAQPEEYFPLQAGNQWVYRTSGFSGGQVLPIEVAGYENVAGRAYFVLRGFPGGELLLRQSPDGNLLIYDRRAGQETLWFPFAAGEGESFDSGIHECSPRGTIVSRSSPYEGPIGSFDNGLEIRYSGGRCADAGLEREIFLPWVGLVRRTETTIGGPRHYDLIYAQLGGVTYVSEPHVSFALAFSSAWRTARLTLRNSGAPIRLQFPTSQDFDLTLRTEAGAEVYRWSAGKSFAQIFRDVNVSGEKNWTVIVPALPAGKYIAEAWLTTEGGKRYVASVGVDLP